MRERHRAAVPALLFALPLLPACGGSSNAPTPAAPPTTTTPAPVQTVVASGATFVPPRVAILIPFETTATGAIDVTVDWTFASNEIDLYLLSGSCTPQQWPRCTFATFSESRDFKPERLRFLGAFAGPYVLAIGNIGPGEESVSYQVVLTTGGLRGQ